MRDSLLYRAVIATVVASGVCLAQEELVAVVRSGTGDHVRITTQEGTCRSDRCPQSAQTYILEEELCGADISLRKSV